ncbi:pyocin knob domain-containing protein [Agrobacterium tumefaciens]|uniref:pyocin knob domain-containing protein n=1 Tax=Agrobacterium tumefaciens TaxID=358 RepID=UPI003B9FECDE
MAGVAYYNTGTATVAVNSKTVTGTGTNWLSVVGGLTAIKAGDKFGIHVGRPIIIASVDSNTQLTLEDNWPGPAQTNAAYRIELTNPDVIAVEALRRVLGSLSGGILYGVSQLTAAPNKALAIDENGAAALADLSPFGKSLIASLNSSAAYGALGVIPNAQLPTRLRALSTVVTSADAVLETGVYAVSASTTGIPVAAAGVLNVTMYDVSSAGVQTYTRTSVANPDVWYRIRVSVSWGAWGRVPNFGANNVIPDVSLPERLREFPVFTSDWNNAKASGFYFGGSTTVNTPVQPYSFVGEVIAQSSTYCVQRLTALGISDPVNNIFYERQLVNNVWSAWNRRFYGDVSGPGTAVTGNSIVGFNGTGGRNVKQLTASEALAALGPVFGGVPPVPSAAGVGMSDGDFNTLTFGGLYTATGSWANGPLGNPATHAGTVEVYQRYLTGIVQVFRNFVSTARGVTYKRNGFRGTSSDPWVWDAWIAEGDVSGPASSVDNGLAVYSGTTGKVLKAAPNSIVTNALLSNVATATIKGRTAAGTGDVQDLTPAQARTVMDVVPSAARQVRLGAQGAALTVIDQWTIAPSGSFLTAIRSDGIYAAREVAYRAVQQTDVSGNWVTVAQV